MVYRENKKTKLRIYSIFILYHIYNTLFVMMLIIREYNVLFTTIIHNCSLKSFVRDYAHKDAYFLFRRRNINFICLCFHMPPHMAYLFWIGHHFLEIVHLVILVAFVNFYSLCFSSVSS